MHSFNVSGSGGIHLHQRRLGWEGGLQLLRICRRHYINRHIAVNNMRNTGPPYGQSRNNVGARKSNNKVESELRQKEVSMDVEYGCRGGGKGILKRKIMKTFNNGVASQVLVSR